MAATQTSKAGGTSELATATTDGEAGSAEGGGGGVGAAVEVAQGSAVPLEASTKSAGESRPRTKIVGNPKGKSKRSNVRFEFKSDEPGSIFLCKLDRKPFDLCRSPKRYKDLKPGRHVFEVRAIDPAGHVDPSPAKKTFTVLG